MTFALAALLIAAPLVLLLSGRGSVGGAALIFILYTRISDLGLHGHSASAVSPNGLSAIAQLVLLSMTAIIFARQTRRGGARTAHAHAFWAASGVYLAVVLASSVWASDEGLATTQGISLAKNLVIAYLIAELLASRRGQRLAVWALIGAGAFMAGLTVLQAGTHTFHSDYFGFAQAPIRQILGSKNSHRSAGPIGDPNFYALVLALIIPIAIYRMRDERSNLLKLAAGGCTLVVLAAIALTYSRGGIVTVLVAIVLSAILLRPRAKQVVAVGLVLLLLVAVLPGDVVGRLATLSKGDTSINDRVGSEKVAVAIFLDHPIVGVGANNFAATYFPYALRLNVPGAANKPHNTYLAIAAETGVLGLATFVTAMSLLVLALWRRRVAAQRVGDREAEGLAATMLLVLLTYLIGVAFLPIAYPRYLWVIIGLAVSVATPEARATLSAWSAREAVTSSQ